MKYFGIIWIVFLTVLGCNSPKEKSAEHDSEMHHDHDKGHYEQPKRQIPVDTSRSITTLPDSSLGEMVKIEGGVFIMGGSGELTRPDEFPKHEVEVSSFYMDIHEVTNRQFREFVDATGYLTIAERKPDWEELKTQLPPGTPKPADDVLVPGSMVFDPKDEVVNLSNYFQWWSWLPGTDWQHPNGPNTNIEGKDDHPVVHICWFDAVAYCEWRGGRLPTEAEWEWAARGGLVEKRYPWGDEHVDAVKFKANSWQGDFPNVNTSSDGFLETAPVMSFAPNNFGLFDMAGNVWEWCSDWYDARYYEQIGKMGKIKNPKGPPKSFDPNDPYAPKRSQRGGSYLCSDVYCASYRVSARMPGEPSTGMPHVGFRMVKDVE